MQAGSMCLRFWAEADRDRSSAISFEEFLLFYYRRGWMLVGTKQRLKQFPQFAAALC